MNTANGRNVVERTATMVMVVVLVTGIAALGGIPVSPQAASGSLVFINETGHAVEGLQITFAAAPADVAVEPMQAILVCGNCLWIGGTILDGDALQLTLDDAEGLVGAYWFSSAPGFLNALWKANRCAVQ